MLVVPVDRRAVGVGRHRPESRAVLLLLPPHRGVLAQEGEPLVGHSLAERHGIEQVDVVEANVADVDLTLRHGRTPLRSDGVSD